MPDLELEQALHKAGHAQVAGIDEAGRGPLAGPVVAGAVILPANFDCPGLNDSKKLSAKKRDALYDIIVNHPGLIWASGSCSCEEIDELNILNATDLAMRRAAEALGTTPDHCLIDGLPIKNFPYPYDAVVKGDAKSLSISAASIIASSPSALTRTLYPSLSKRYSSNSESAGSSSTKSSLAPDIANLLNTKWTCCVHQLKQSSRSLRGAIRIL